MPKKENKKSTSKPMNSDYESAETKNKKIDFEKITRALSNINQKCKSKK